MSREAMQMALEALEANLGNWAAKTKAVEVLRQAMETETELVAWASSLDFDDDDQEIIPAKDKGKLGTSNCDIPLYTAPQKAEQEPVQPPEWVGLTNKDIDDCYFAARQPDFDIWAFAAEIEEVLKQKNAWGNHLV